MFDQIQNISSNWVSEQRNLLIDCQLLLQHVNPDLGCNIQGFAKRLSTLDKKSQDAFLKDHVFHNWLRTIKKEVLNFYEKREHLPKLKKIYNIIELLNLAVAVLSKRDCKFVLYSTSVSKFLLPVSGFHISLKSIKKNNGFIHCRYLHASEEVEVGSVRYTFSTFQQIESIKIADRNFNYFLDPAANEYSAEFDKDIDLNAWTNCLDRALKIIRADESSFELVTRFAAYLVPLKQKDSITNLSFSVRDLPGVIFKNNELTPYLVGETLVHESDHQFFYAIEKFNNYWNEEANLQQPIHFSPWRDDPRPLDGILRGLSSFARVSQYYSIVIRANKLPEQQYYHVGLILLTRLTQSENALKTLLKSQQLSSFGLQYVEEIQNTLKSVNDIVKSFPQYKIWNNFAIESLLRHRKNWELINQSHV